MKELLSTAGIGALAHLAQSRALLAFDFDGTLAPIHVDRELAFMRSDTATLFAGLCARYPCAIISGRGSGDVEKRLAGAPVMGIFGNHGAESGRLFRQDPWSRQIARLRALLERALRGVRGVDIEDKRYSLSVHTRATPRAHVVREIVFRLVNDEFRVIPGKHVMNLVPTSAPDKGDALAALMRRRRVERAFYIGDDDTDEDVFARARQNARVITVRVGKSARSAASYYVRSQRDVDDVLELLAQFRAVG